jgi:hypothetical protein
MKAEVFKNLIKESLREVLKEELANLQLAPKATPLPSPVSQMATNPIPNRLATNPLQEMLAQTRASMHSSEYKTVLDMDSGMPNMGNVDLVNGRLPEGEVSMNTIMKLVGRK